MTITGAQKDLIEHVVNVFETGSPRGDYGEVCTYRDGHDGTRQITYGRAQTTEQGNLRDLITLYVNNGGTYANFFRPYLPEIGKVPLANDLAFKSALRSAGTDSVMIAAEDTFFDFDYFAPAIKWCEANGFTTALAALVVYDSFIHSGAILNFLRARFHESPPAAGGEEEIWLKEYVFVRADWLANYRDPLNPAKAALLRQTTYRTSCLMREIVRKNWDLSQLPILANGVEVSS